MSEKADSLAELSSETINLALESVLEEVGANLSNLASQGCICCDVGSGPEILAMNQYHPKIFIASEPLDIQYPKDELSLQQVKSKVPGVELIRREPENALKELAKRKNLKVGLITWLRIFPDNGYDNFLHFFQLAQPLLINGGVAIASVAIGGMDNEESDNGLDLMRTASQVKALGFKVDLPDREQGLQSVGGLFLVATKQSQV